MVILVINHLFLILFKCILKRCVKNPHLSLHVMRSKYILTCSVLPLFPRSDSKNNYTNTKATASVCGNTTSDASCVTGALVWECYCDEFGARVTNTQAFPLILSGFLLSSFSNDSHVFVKCYLTWMDPASATLVYLSFASCALLNCTPRKSCTRCKRPEGSSKDVADSKGYQLL